MSNMRKIKNYLYSISLIFISVTSYAVEVLEVKILDSYLITKEFPGRLLPVEQSKLSFEIAGKISNIFVDVGDKVEKGQSLAKLDDREAKARLNQAKATYDLSIQVFKRFQDLREQGHISIQDLDKAKSDSEAEKERVSTELKSEVADLSLEISQKVASSMTKKDQQKLIDKFIKDMG